MNRKIKKQEDSRLWGVMHVWYTIGFLLYRINETFHKGKIEICSKIEEMEDLKTGLFFSQFLVKDPTNLSVLYCWIFHFLTGEVSS